MWTGPTVAPVVAVILATFDADTSPVSRYQSFCAALLSPVDGSSSAARACGRRSGLSLRKQTVLRVVAQSRSS